MSSPLAAQRTRPRLSLGIAMALVAACALALWAWRTWSPAQRWLRTIRDADAAGARWDLSTRALRGEYPSIGPDRAITELIAALSDPHPNVRADAAGALGQGSRQAERAIPELIKALHDPSTATRMGAAGSLSQIVRAGARGRDTVIAPLTDSLEDASPTVRCAAAAALVRILRPGDPGAERATAALFVMLNDPHPNVRVHAAWALAQLGRGKSCIGTLIGALDDSDTMTRSLAVGTLAQIGPPARAALPALTAVAGNDRFPWLQDEAAKAIALIDQPDAR